MDNPRPSIFSVSPVSVTDVAAPPPGAPAITPAPRPQGHPPVAWTVPSLAALPGLDDDGADEPKPVFRPLPLMADPEPAWKRYLFLGVGFAVALGFFLFVNSFFGPGPGNPGIDENAYLVGGKLAARHLSPGIKPSSPYAYVSMMWVKGKNGYYYPKYPAGIPLLNAAAICIGGGHNNNAAYYTNPVCATLAVLAMFLLTRALAGSFLGVMGAIALATNSTHLHLALIPSSHAPAICFTLWGMYLLVCWWRSGYIVLGIGAGLLLGYAVTIRYTEGLLGLPLGAVAIATIRWKQLGSYLRAALPVAAWALPVAALVCFNYLTTGHYTGYDSTNESTGFFWAEFMGKWETTVQQLYVYGLFFLFPLGFLGMLLMFDRAWRMGMLMVLWFIPGGLLYTSYYWGQQTPGVGYLRFFLTLYPPIIASGMWLIAQVARRREVEARAGAAPAEPNRTRAVARGSVFIPLGAGILTAAVAAVGIYVEVPDLERTQVYNLNLGYSGQALLQTVPAARRTAGKAEPMLYGDESGMFSRTLMHLQFVGDGEWFSANAFSFAGGFRRGMMGFGATPRFGAGGGAAGANPDDAPRFVEKERAEEMTKLYSGATSASLAAMEKKLVGEAIDSGRGVYAVLAPASVSNFKSRMIDEGFECKNLAIWTEPLYSVSITTDTTPARGGGGGMFGGPGGGGRGGRGGPGGGGGGPGGFGRTNNGLAPPGGRGGGMMDGTAETLQVIQVKRPAPKTPVVAPVAPVAPVPVAPVPVAATAKAATVPASQP